LEKRDLDGEKKGGIHSNEGTKHVALRGGGGLARVLKKAKKKKKSQLTCTIIMTEEDNCKGFYLIQKRKKTLKFYALGE